MVEVDRGNHARVLVVEDDDELRTALYESLLAEGYEVRSSSNGAEALDVLHHGWKPDVILLDLMMPVMNGWQFRSVQQQDPDLASIPVVVLSAVGNHVQSVAPIDVAAFMRKPFELDALLETIDRYAHAA